MARRVASERGARYYGVPIGHLITPDKEDEAQARHGGRPAPHGSVTGTNQKREGQSQVTNGSKSKAPTKAKKASGGVGEAEETGLAAKGFKQPTLTGPVTVLVGKKKFSAPEGSVVYKSPAHSGRSYVVTPDGQAHVLTSHGELNLSPEEGKLIAKQVEVNFERQGTASGGPEEEEDVTWIRLISIVRQIAQADRIGDTSEAKRLLLQFREAANSYDPDQDPRETRTRVKRAAGIND